MTASNLPTDLVAQETVVDTHSPADVAMWLRRRARINREFAESPPAQHVLESWQRNVMPHLAFRFEQIADLVEKQAERNAWLENYVKACDNEVKRASERKRQWELEPPHCSSCSCGAPDVPAPVVCANCDGTGWFAEDEKVPCDECADGEQHYLKLTGHLPGCGVYEGTQRGPCSCSQSTRG